MKVNTKNAIAVCTLRPFTTNSQADRVERIEGCRSRKQGELRSHTHQRNQLNKERLRSRSKRRDLAIIRQEIVDLDKKIADLRADGARWNG